MSTGKNYCVRLFVLLCMFSLHSDSKSEDNEPQTVYKKDDCSLHKPADNKGNHTSSDEVMTAIDGNFNQRTKVDQHYIESLLSCTSDKEYCFPCSKGHCKCGKIPHHILRCIDEQLSVLGCYCTTYNEKEGLVEVGSCMYTCGNIFYHPLPHNATGAKLNAFMCGNLFHRGGTLCGKCEDDFYPLVYSFDMTCVRCPHGRSNWWKFVLAAFLPLTVFYFAVLFLRINATTSSLHGYIFFCQAVTMPQIVRFTILEVKYNPQILKPFRFISALYGVWNLDFFRSADLGICLGTDTLLSLALELVVCVYLLVLMLLSYLMIYLHGRNFRPVVIIWKPFQTVFRLFHKNWDIRTSLVDSFATFFLLSNIKFLSVVFDLLVPVKVYEFSLTSEHFSYSWRLFYDADVVYFGRRHLPYAIIAITVLVLFVLLPIAILMLYPLGCFQKLLRVFPFRWHILHTFVDAFQGCYKDGTEPGIRDCRWFASFFLALRLVGYIIGAITFNSMYLPFCAMLIVLTVFLLTVVQPFKSHFKHCHEINVMFFMFLASLYLCLIGRDLMIFKYHTMIWFMSALLVLTCMAPLLYMSIITLHWLYRHRKFGWELIKRAHALRAGYDLLM